MFKSIKTKFIAFATLFIIISVGIPTSFLLNQLTENFNERSLLMLNTTLDILNHSINHEMELGDKKDIQGMLNDVSLNKGIDHLRILNHEGIVVFATQQNEIGKHINVVSPHHVNFDLRKLDHRHIDLFGEKNIYSAIEPIYNKTDCQNCHSEENIIAFLDVDTDLTKAEVRFKTGANSIVYLALVIVLFLSGGLYIIFNYLINRPLEKFLLAFDKVGQGNFDTKLNVKGEGEIGRLGSNFNRMVNMLKSSKEKIDELHFKQLMHADRLTTIGELTSGLAHEINNHSGIILSRTEYLQLKAAMDKNLDNIKDDLAVITSQVDKLSNLTRHILKHSKVNKTEFKKINLTHVITDAIQTLKPLIENKGISINKNFNNDGYFVFGDPDQLEQVLINLFNNAADALDSKGEIRVTVEKNNEKIFLSVQDNGQGISGEIEDQIFHPFYTTKKDDKGTGLGLYIVKNIVENHNGTIDCESEVGKGTSFKITLEGIGDE